MVAAAMVLLPLIYPTLIGLVGCLAWLHAANNDDLLEHRACFLLYLGPIVAGGILVVFMVKPFFAPRARGPTLQAIRPEDEPFLLAFVERLASLVGAPPPREINANCEVNASASFRRGFLSLFSQDLTLTIGLPLVAELNLGQFAGVLAHELGHFAQRAGMRLTYVIRQVNAWFARAVYERDAWDLRLDQLARDSDVRIGSILHLARLLIWLTRKILSLLMALGHLISCYMLRQMEYDADRYEVFVSGSDVFEATCRRLPLLDAATRAAMMDLQRSWLELRLADDFPSLMLANEKQMPAAVVAAAAAEISEQRTRAFETHPCTKDRIAASRRAPTDGVFRHEGPASLLFKRFERLCRASSLDYYRELIGQEVEPEQLVTVGELVARESRKAEELKASMRFFQQRVSVLRPVTLPAELGSSADARQIIADVRERLVAGRPGYQEAYRRYDELDTRLIELGQVEALLRASFQLDEGTFGLERPSLDECRTAQDSARAELRALADRLEPVERIAGERLRAALALLQEPEIAAAVEDGPAALEEICQKLPILSRVARLLPAALPIRNECAAVAVLNAQLEGNAGRTALIGELSGRIGNCWNMLAELRHRTADIASPCDGARETTLAQHLAPSFPEIGKPDAILSGAEGATERLWACYVQVISRLSSIAERVERAVGLDPLPELELPEDDNVQS